MIDFVSVLSGVIRGGWNPNIPPGPYDTKIQTKIVKKNLFVTLKIDILDFFLVYMTFI